MRSHALRFHKRSIDGSGKADAYATGDSADYVWGVVNDIDPTQKEDLDRVEGLGSGYDEKCVTVEAEDGRELDVLLYFATDIDPSLVPYGWYKRYVLLGARKHAFPDSYLKEIEAQESRPDPNRERASRHEIVEC